MATIQSSLSSRVLFLSLAPMLVLTLILGFYFTSTKLDDSRNALIDKGTELARLLSAASVFGIFSGNISELNPLSTQLLKDPMISDVIFLDVDKNVVFRTEDQELPINLLIEEFTIIDDYWYFLQPVRVGPIQFSDNPEYDIADTQREIIGWVILLVSAKPMIKRQNYIILGSLQIIMIGFVITLMLAKFFGRRITEPIIGLTEVIKRLQRGELNARARNSATLELNMLSSGINQLAANVQLSRREAELRIEKATKALSRSLHDIETTNLELIKAREKADDANHAKDAFLARMSHELRTPLTSVIGFTQMLKLNNRPEETQNYLRIIDQTSQTLLTIIDDILDFTRLESDVMRLEEISFSPAELFYKALEMQAPTAHGKGLELIYNPINALPPYLKGDPTRIRQIITNLVSNAIKFTEQGEVIISPYYDHKNGGALKISIRDTGIGISEEYKQSLFSSFTQADSSISRRFGGSGLGLAIVNRLVSLMQGSICVESYEGIGSEFVVSLPIQTHTYRDELLEMLPISVAIYDPHPKVSSALHSQLQNVTDYSKEFTSIKDLLKSKKNFNCIVVGFPPKLTNERLLQMTLRQIRHKYKSIKLIFMVPSDRKFSVKDKNTQLLSKPVSPSKLYSALGFRNIQYTEENQIIPRLHTPLDILVAEDNKYNRLLINRMLTEAGATVRNAETGLEVIEKVKECAPDLIMMDINMPDMDGIQASKLLKKTHPGLEIIALTANISPREREALNATGIFKVLLKPINIDKLSDLLNSALAKKDSRLPKIEIRFTETRQLTTISELKNELIDQINEIEACMKTRSFKQMDKNLHQLKGFSGIFEKPEIEHSAASLSDAIKSDDIKTIWKAYYRLKRVVDIEET